MSLAGGSARVYEMLTGEIRGADFVVDLSATPISHKSYREH